MHEAVLPPFLNPGDTVAIVAPAKEIDLNKVLNAKNLLETKGYKVVLGKQFSNKSTYFSGNVLERLTDFQNQLDDSEVKAIFCARGGYGSVQIIDRLNWAGLLRSPKWIVGFSDITYFHQKLSTLNIGSIHGTMPLNFAENSEPSLDTLFDALEGKEYRIDVPYHSNNKLGKVKGRLIGGNLSILYALLGTNDQPEYNNSILFIEDLCEPLYHIDRMLYSFSKAGIFDKISGLIIGGMSSLSDSSKPFGSSYEEIILSHLSYKKIPVCFNFPCGHLNDNRALLLGKNVELIVNKEKSLVSF